MHRGKSSFVKLNKVIQRALQCESYLRSGDLFGSGTLSGPKPEQAGSLLELTQGGKQAITLSNGENRIFLQDGDSIALKGWCEKSGAVRIGFGECIATVMPAKAA